MNAIDYCQIAISKDKSRYNIAEVYRDTHALYGTDGHRLHFIDGLPEAKPHFPSGLDAEFPDCSAVLPKGNPVATCTFRAPLESLAVLKRLAKVHEFPAVSLGFDVAEKHLCVWANLFTKVKFGHAPRTTFSHTWDVLEADASCNFNVRINLKYFVEALIRDALIRLEFHGEEASSARELPLLVVNQTLDGERKALIMPLQ